MRFTKISVLALLAAMMFFASTASAAVVLGGPDGWSFSTDGQVNIFGVYQTQDEIPATAIDPFVGSTDQEGFRLKSGFLPACIAFNVKAPTMGGLDMGARVGFYPEPANANTKNTFDAQIDLREVFFTVDGSFGQILAGKALSLFLGQNLLTEQTLLGAGRMAGNLNANVGPTLGRIGYGYVYPQFSAQVRYTTPDMSGVKFALGIYDPSVIASGVLGGGTAYSETKLPRLESELSYAGTFGDGNTLKLYFNNLWQEAENAAGDDVTAWGIGGGAILGIGPVELSASGFTGEALGRSLMLDSEALDATGEERETWGWIAQAIYSFGQNKIGISYGGNEYDETDAEKVVRDAGGANSAEIESQYMLNAMFTHDVNANLKLVAEISYIENEWFDGSDWQVEQFNLGAFFLW